MRTEGSAVHYWCCVYQSVPGSLTLVATLGKPATPPTPDAIY